MYFVRPLISHGYCSTSLWSTSSDEPMVNGFPLLISRCWLSWLTASSVSTQCLFLVSIIVKKSLIISFLLLHLKAIQEGMKFFKFGINSGVIMIANVMEEHIPSLLCCVVEEWPRDMSINETIMVVKDFHFELQCIKCSLYTQASTTSTTATNCEELICISQSFWDRLLLLQWSKTHLLY